MQVKPFWLCDSYFGIILVDDIAIGITWAGLVPHSTYFIRQFINLLLLLLLLLFSFEDIMFFVHLSDLRHSLLYTRKSQCQRELANAYILDHVVSRYGLQWLGNGRDLQNAVSARVKITLLKIMATNGLVTFVAIGI
jgi:hypothetical protein